MKSTLCLIQQGAVKYSSKIALESGPSTLTYNELDRIVSEASQLLSGLGIKEGTVVAYQYPNSWRAIVLLFALFRLRAIASPLSIWLPSEAVLTQRKTLGAHRWLEPSMIESLIPHRSTLAASYSEACFRSPATLLFTSGSSGSPKAALHSQIQHLFSALGSNENIPLEPGNRWLLNLPLYHVGGLAVLFRCWIAGATVVLPDGINPYSIEDLKKKSLTHVSFVPTQLFRALSEAHSDPQCPRALKCALIGGAPLTDALKNRALELGWPLATSYGLTEMSSQVTTTKPGSTVSHSGSVLRYRELKIDASGEILVKGPTLFSGYWTNGAAEAHTDHEDWFHTGDLGLIENDGGLKVIGRKDYLFFSGGENIQPEEIEGALMRLKDVEQAIVVPVPHPEFGSRPVAFVRTPELTSKKMELWRQELTDTLPRFKIPDQFLPWPEGPEGNSLKPNRRALCAIAESFF